VFRIVLLVLLTTPALAQQRSSSGMNYWDGKRHDFPQCTGLVNQHESLTKKLDALAEQARYAVEPERKQILDQINATAKERTQVQKELDACTREVIDSTRKSSLLLKTGAVEEVTLPPDEFASTTKMAEQVGEVADRGALGELFTGIAEWGQEQLNFLAQKPGVPLNQMAEGIVKYLTNKNSDNHAALRGAAEEAVKQFQENPARFIGKNLPNLVPLPKAKALAQLAKVKSGTQRVLNVAAAEQRFASAYKGSLTAKVGTDVVGDGCLATNACVRKAVAQDLLWRSEEPFVIKGVKISDRPDLAMEPPEIYEVLNKHSGETFVPRKPDLYTPEQLDLIKQGIPIEGTLEDIGNWLKNNGEGSQGIVFAEFHPIPEIGLNDPRGHAWNMRYHQKAIESLDNTGMVAKPEQVKKWFFYPTR
jgi:hypothetical protein